MRRAFVLLLASLLPLACVLDLDRLQLSPDASVAQADGALPDASPAADSGPAPGDAGAAIPDGGPNADTGPATADASSALPDAGPGVWLQFALGLSSAKVIDLHPGWDSKPVAWVIAEKGGETYVGCCPNGECVWTLFSGRARALVRGLVGSDALVVGDDSAVQRCVYDGASAGRVTCEPLAFAVDAGLGSLRVASRTGDEMLALSEEKNAFQLLHVFDGGVVAQRSASGPQSPRQGRGPTGEHWVVDSSGDLYKCLVSQARCTAAQQSGVTGLQVVSSPAGEQVLIAQGNVLRWKARTQDAASGVWRELSLSTVLDDISAVGGQDMGALFVSGTRGGNSLVLAVQVLVDKDGALLSSKSQEDVARAALHGIEVHNCPWAFGPDAIYVRMMYGDCCLDTLEKCL